MKIVEKYSVFTNIVYFGLFIYASLDGNNYIALLLLFILIGSSFFHITKPQGFTWWNRFHTLNLPQKIFFLLDNISVYAIIIYLFLHFNEIGFSKIPISFIIFSILGLIIFFFKNKKNYDFYHGLWHIISSIVILIFIYNF